MNAEKLIAINLDGYEHSLAESMANSGELPNYKRLADRSARYLLDHGADLRTGLAGEHVATGLSAADANRWAAVHFDPETYEVWQEGTALVPFPARYGFRTVVIDAPYFDLARTPNVQGFVGWGAHDPGVPQFCRPSNLLEQIEARFGNYPAGEWIYGTPWNSVERSARMGEELASAVRKRANVTTWVLRERIPDWDLALVTVSEAHSVIEGLWHGIDRNHPLHGVPSGEIAGAGVRDVYRAIDQFIGELVAAFPDATVVLFSMHGMGSNGSDAASMFLLGEFLYRHAFDEPLHVPVRTPMQADGIPLMDADQSWRPTVRAGFLEKNGIVRKLRHRIARFASGIGSRQRPIAAGNAGHSINEGPVRAGLDWMPLMAYRQYWPSMPAFALPSFYDGRIRVNLAGREADGVVDPADYEQTLDRISAEISSCVDPITGRPVVTSLERNRIRDPVDLGSTEADLVIVWSEAPLGFQHPRLGTIGPIPYRRTGGHTGRYGFALFAGNGIDAADRGTVSAYDVVPSIIELLGARPDEALSGGSLFGALTYNR